MDGEVVRMMQDRGPHYVPTISAGNRVYERAQDPSCVPPVVRPEAISIGPQIQATCAKASQAGVKIMFGTDRRVRQHGSNARQFACMMQAIIPAMEGIRSATITSARFCGLADRPGSVEAGELADIVAVDGDPLEEITAMQRVSFVVTQGVVCEGGR